MPTSRCDGGGHDDLLFVYLCHWFSSAVPSYTFIATDSTTSTTSLVHCFDEKALTAYFGRRSPIHQDRTLRLWRGPGHTKSILTKKIRGGKGTLITHGAVVAWICCLRQRIMTAATSAVAARMNDEGWLIRIQRVSSVRSYSMWIIYTILTAAEFATDMTRAEQKEELKRLRSTQPIQNEAERDNAARAALLKWKQSIICPETRTNAEVTPPAACKRRRITPEFRK